MTGISSWILSILGVILLSILVDIILPDGKSSKFIKGVFGYLIIIVILVPIFKFITKKEFNFDDIFKSSPVNVQPDFIASVRRQYLTTLENEIKNKCEEEGLKNIKIGIEADVFAENMTIIQISVDVQNIVIDKNSSHKDIKTTITNIILKNINIEKELIVFYE